MSPKPQILLDSVHNTIRLKLYSTKTKQAYLNWIKQKNHFHEKTTHRTWVSPL